MTALLNGIPITEFQPQNNKQAYLAYLCGAGNKLPEPRTVEEVLLYNLCMSGGVGGGNGGADAVVFTERDENGHPLAVDASGLTVLHTSQFYSGRADCPCATVKMFVLPKGITEIPDYVFAYCANMESLNIPDGVTRIGEGAFNGCTKLKNVVIPNTVKEIDKKAFYDCSSLEAVTLPDGVTEIGDSAFRGCKSLTSFTFPASVDVIGSQVFYGCDALTSVTFEGVPSELSSIAFLGSDVTDIYVPWSEGEVLGAPWSATATIHYNQ